MKKALLYLFIFIVVQVFGSWGTYSAWLLISGRSMAEVWQTFVTTSFADATAPMIITATAVYSIILLIVFIYFKWSTVSPNYLRTRQWGVFFWCILAAVGTILPSIWLQEQLPELPDSMTETFSMIMDNDYGYFAVCIFAPLVEELVFRGAILRSLLGSLNKHWLAILISAILFALIHLNLAQMPHAFIIGLLLGWIYYRTGSILPGVAFHWVNNTAAFVAYKVLPQAQDMRLIDFFHGNNKSVTLCIVFSLLILLPSLYQLNWRMRK